jgi:MFS family permease
MLTRLGLSRNLTVLCVTIFANLFARFLWYPLLPLHLRALGANEWEIGVSFTLTSLGQTLSGVIGGALADRFGRRAIIASSTLAIAPLYFLAGMNSNWMIVVALIVGVNALGALQWPALSALIAESSTEDRIARSFGIVEFAVLAGSIAGPIVGAALVSASGIPMLLFASGATLLATGILRAVGLRDTSWRAVGSALPKLRAALDANMRWVIVMGACIAVAFSITFGPFFAILARDEWRNSRAEINLLYAAGNVAALFGIAAGRFADRWGARRVLMIGALGYGVCSIAWGVAPTWQWGIAPLLLAFAFSEGVFIAQQTLQAQVTTRETRSTMIGILTTTNGLFAGLGPTFGAWLITLSSNPAPFIAAGAMGLLTILAAIPIREKSSRAD